MQQSNQRTKATTTVPTEIVPTEIVPVKVEQIKLASNENEATYDSLSNSAESPESETLMIGERRQRERRSNEQRRSGARGVWEDRRLFDRRHREYSIFGKRIDGADESNEANPLHLPDVPLSEIISPAELRILEEQAELEETQKPERKNDL